MSKEQKRIHNRQGYDETTGNVKRWLVNNQFKIRTEKAQREDEMLVPLFLRGLKLSEAKWDFLRSQIITF